MANGIVERIQLELRAFRVMARYTFSSALVKEWYILALPFEIVNLAIGLLTWYYFGLMFGVENVPLLRQYGGSFLSYLLLGVAANSVFTYALSSFVMAVSDAYAATIVMGATRLNWIDYLRLLGIPLWRWMYVRVVLGFIPSLINLAAYVVFGAFFLGFTLPPSADVTGSLASLTLGVIGLVGISLIGAGFLLYTRILYARDPVTWMVGLLSSIVAGIYFPPEILPEWLRTTSTLLPQTYALRVARLCLLAGRAGACQLGGIASPLSLIHI